MSDLEDAIYSRLQGRAELTALIGERAYPVQAPQNVTAPFVVFQRIAAPRETAFGADPGMVSARVQFSPYSNSFDEMRLVRTEVRKALERWRGVTAGVTIDDAFIETDQDLFDDDTKFFYGPMDVIVHYREATV